MSGRKTEPCPGSGRYSNAPTRRVECPNCRRWIALTWRGIFYPHRCTVVAAPVPPSPEGSDGNG